MLGVFSLPEPVTFRPGFLWGSATAGHQIEGGNIHSHKYRMELDGKFPECSGKACNFRELYRQDIDLLAELGHQAFRLSLEWPRIEPAPGVHDEAEMKWYLQVLELLKEKKIRICVTLMHLSHPQWFEEMGEFHRRENVDYFLRHLEYLVPQVAPYADSWIVLNEFNGSEDPRCVERKVNCLVAHARAAELIRNYSNAPVSTAHALVDWQPENPEDFFDRVRADLRDWVGNRFFFHAVRTGIVLSPPSGCRGDSGTSRILRFLGAELLHAPFCFGAEISGDCSASGLLPDPDDRRTVLSGGVLSGRADPSAGTTARSACSDHGKRSGMRR